jgi:hypothetical protein
VEEDRDYPEADDYLAECQSRTHYRFGGKLYPRLPYGSETFRTPAEAGRRRAGTAGRSRGSCTIRCATMSSARCVGTR